MLPLSSEPVQTPCIRGIAAVKALTVDVNEQNPRAYAFYQRYSFVDVGRSEVDSAGRPFPLLHMSLVAAGQRNELALEF
jgi:hypothetical protein